MQLGLEDKTVILTIYKKLTDTSKLVVKKMGLSIDVDEINMSNFIEKAKEYKKKGKEIIITRGIIADIIRSEVDINVISINITGYDLLKTLHKFKGYKKPIAVLSPHDSLSSAAKRIGELLELDIRTYPCKEVTMDKTYEIRDRFVKNGIDTMIGFSSGNDTITEFKNMDVNFTVIDSEEISLVEAVNKAIELYQMTMKERKIKERLKTIIDYSPEGIMTIDEDGIITTFNWKSEMIFRVNGSEILGENIEDVFPEIGLLKVLKTGEAEISKIVNMKGVQIVADLVPIKIDDTIMGAVVTLKEIKEIQDVEQKIRLSLAEKGLTAKYTFQNIIGNSEKMRQIIKMAKTYTEASSTVLITGETGTGKEVFAQAIHNASPKRNNAFVAINCSALPPNLLESELFGYSEGAFTGARKGGKKGLFELAHNGTIFLDEIGEMNKSMQSRLLRVIQEREIMRIGDDKVIPIDVRIIAATNKDLYEEVEKDNFRMDLYFRLNILDLHIAPLRERKEDIEDLIKGLLHQLNSELNCRVTGLDDDVLRLFMNYDWPGNIREIRNVLEKLVVITKSGIVRFNDVEYVLDRLSSKIKDIKKDDAYNGTLEEMERDIILRVLREENNNKTQTAKRLGISRNALKRKLSKDE